MDNIDPRLLGAYTFTLLFVVAMPILLAVYVHRRLRVSWRYFWYGALIFFLFQLATRVPAVQLLQFSLAEPLRRSMELQWVWIFALALTAGLFEEVGRFLGYRYLVFRGVSTRYTRRRGNGDDKSELEASAQPPESPQIPPAQAWNRGVMFGLGHGGLESILLVGGSILLALINTLVVLRMDPATVAALPPEQAAAIQQARAALSSVPWWYPLLGAFERLCTVIIQVGFSILVLQVFLQGSLRWLFLAIGAHFLVDLIAVASGQRLGAVATEGVIALFAVAAAYLIFRLRPTTR